MRWRRWPGRRSPGHPVRRDTPALAAAVPTMAAGVLPPILTGALVVPMRADLTITEAHVGIGMLAFFSASGAFSAWGGRLAERLGPVVSMRATAVIGAASLLGTATVHSWAQVVALLALAGAGQSLAQPVCNALLVRAARPGRRSLAFGINQAAVPASTLLSGLAVPALALTAGWRWAFATAAACVVLAVFAFTPRTASWAASAPAPARGPAPGSEPAPAAGRAPLPALSMVLIALSGACSAGAYSVLSAFGVSSGVVSGLSPAAAGTVQAIASVSSIGVRVAAGWLGDRRGDGHFAAVAYMQVVGSAGLLLVAAGQPAAFTAGLLVAYASGWGVTGLYNFAISRRYQERTAAATGIISTGVYTGAGVGPVLFGQLAGGVSLSASWQAMAVISLASSALLLVLTRRDRAGGTQPASA